MQLRQISIHRTFLIYLVLVGFISVFSVGYLWISSEWSRFEEETNALRASYLETHKELLKREAKRALDYVKYIQSQTEKLLQDSIKSRVYEAYSIAENIYRKQRNRKSIEEIKEIVKEALRPIRFNKGRGYYFAFSLEGIETLFAVSPEMEGKSMLQVKGGKGELVVPNMLAVIKEKGEGFYRYTWPKPNQHGYFPKIAFVKLFKPFGWVIGTGEYVDDVEKDVQEECIKWISNIKFGKDGYVFAGQWDGLSLSGPAIGKNMYDVEDINGVKIVRELIEAAKSGGGFVNYVLPKFEGKKHAPKISYAVGLPKWEWYIGSGVYVDEIETEIALKQSDLEKRIRTNTRNTFFILFALLVFIALIVKLLSNRIRNNLVLFGKFFSRASSDAIRIDRNALHFVEFATLAESANEMVDKRKRTEEALRKSEEKYKDLAGSLPQVVFETDATGNLTFVNKNAFDLFGYTDEDFNKGLNALQMIVPKDRDRAMKNIQKILNGDILGGEEYTALRKDGTTFLVEIHSNLFMHENKPIGLRGLIIDLSESKKMETDLKRLSMAMDQSNETIVITNTKGLIAYVNPAFEKTTGYSHAEALGKNPRILQSGKHDAMFYHELWQTISKGKTWSGRFVNRKKDGSQYTEEATISPVFSDEGEIVNYVAVKRDISDKLKLEARLQQAQKMEAIGNLAGGIAHDFNNILFPLVGYAEMLKLDLPADSPLHGHIDEILHAALRSKDLVKQILTFSRQGDQDIKPIKLQPIVKEAIKLLRSSIPTTIDIQQDIDPDCGVVVADPTQIHQIVMNLATNAYHSMEKTGGKLTVNLKEVALAVEDLKDPAMIPGKYVCLTVADTGQGMEQHIVDRIFDPYFTTKKAGKGTGLGLAVVHGIVKSHSGDISVYSEFGNGTEFKVYLPLIKGKKETSKTETDTPIQKGNERILLVDDEQIIVQMEKQMLERLGYHVTTRISSVDALEAFRANSAKFDLVITDMTMPNMTGEELARELIKIRSDIPVILCTGFSEMMSREKTESLGIKGFLMKPVVLKDLSGMIRKVLDQN